MRAMLTNFLGSKPQRLSSSELRLLKQAESVLLEDDDKLPSSPCISVCRMSENTGLCEGCFRTIEEITGWGHRSGEEKRAVWRMITQRLQARTL
jgi:predicted Fe-S protein YdhL (DUF1289 family)